MLVIFTFLEAVAVISSRLFGMMARAHACSRRDWSADGSCGPCWQTALSRSALRNYPICYPELTGGCRGKPGVHKPPVKLCLFDSWIESDAIFAANMVDSS